MEAIILAGGFGTRLRQSVPDLPKSMAPVGGRPFLEILLTLLARKGIERVVLSLGYMSEKVVQYFGHQFADIELVYEIEDTPLGTGGAIRQSLKRCNSDHVFIFNGDTYLDVEVSEIEKHWLAYRVPIIVACEVADTARYGRLNTLNSRLLGFSEKGLTGQGLINAGCYVLPTNIFDEFTCGTAFSLESDFLEKSVAQRHFDVFITKGKFIDIGVPQDFERAQEYLSGVCI